MHRLPERGKVPSKESRLFALAARSTKRRRCSASFIRTATRSRFEHLSRGALCPRLQQGPDSHRRASCGFGPRAERNRIYVWAARGVRGRRLQSGNEGGTQTPRARTDPHDSTVGRPVFFDRRTGATDAERDDKPNATNARSAEAAVVSAATTRSDRR